MATTDPLVDPGVVAGSDPQVPERARRRSFTAAYKLEVLAEYDAAGPGEKGGVLRRRGLYSSHLVEWRRARDAGALAGLSAVRGRPPLDPAAREIERLRRENARLAERLSRTELALEVSGKVHALLESLSESAPELSDDPTSPDRPGFGRDPPPDDGVAAGRRRTSTAAAAIGSTGPPDPATPASRATSTAMPRTQERTPDTHR